MGDVGMEQPPQTGPARHDLPPGSLLRRGIEGWLGRRPAPLTPREAQAIWYLYRTQGLGIDRLQTAFKPISKDDLRRAIEWAADAAPPA